MGVHRSRNKPRNGPGSAACGGAGPGSVHSATSLRMKEGTPLGHDGTGGHLAGSPNAHQSPFLGSASTAWTRS
jgi:hypothetical protein